MGHSRNSPAPRRVQGGRLGSGPGAMLWVGGTGPSLGMLARCLGLAANFANNSSRVLSLQLLGAATHWDPSAPRFEAPGAGSSSPPLPSQPKAAVRGSVRVSWGICWQLAAFITHGDAICGEGTEPRREAQACGVPQHGGTGDQPPILQVQAATGGYRAGPSRLESSGAIFQSAVSI